MWLDIKTIARGVGSDLLRYVQNRGNFRRQDVFAPEQFERTLFEACGR